MLAGGDQSPVREIGIVHLGVRAEDGIDIDGSGPSLEAEDRVEGAKQAQRGHEYRERITH